MMTPFTTLFSEFWEFSCVHSFHLFSLLVSVTWSWSNNFVRRMKWSYGANGTEKSRMPLQVSSGLNLDVKQQFNHSWDFCSYSFRSLQQGPQTLYPSLMIPKVKSFLEYHLSPWLSYQTSGVCSPDGDPSSVDYNHQRTGSPFCHKQFWQFMLPYPWSPELLAAFYSWPLA